ncbi:MAG: TRAM domain-containing protein [Planctomycetota bacterium]|nr:TRAM domain-containing protein [Planctomycetota bacterium]
MPNVALIILRCTFVLVAAGLGVGLINSTLLPDNPEQLPLLVLSGIVALALLIIGIDAMFPRKRLESITAVYFGMIVGMFLTYVVRLALYPLLPDANSSGVYWFGLILGMILCYTCVSVLLQTKDDFRFIIPYVEFAKEIKGRKPYVLDTSVVIDGRIADVVETQVFDNQLIMPRFVIAELQGIADSSDRMRRSRGRRGLDILNRLRANTSIDVMIFDRELPEFTGQPVDLKLVLLAKHLNGRVVTNDYNLNKVAKLHGVEVINLNDLANALKPVFLVGETIDVRVVKAGESPGQGIGYLDDGTMIVVEGGRDHINTTIRVVVTSMLQKSAGRMVFGRYEGALPAEV